MSDLFFMPKWPKPWNVNALITTRQGGSSHFPYDSLNLALHVGDEPETVSSNRHVLADAIGEALDYQWVSQVHGNEVLRLDEGCTDEHTEADAIYTRLENVACGVLTADCLSVFFCDEAGDEIAVAHAGWRGLVSGVLEKTIASFSAEPAGILACLGPVIGHCHFEVGIDVRDAFLELGNPEINDQEAILFHETESEDKWMADLFAIAKILIAARGVKQIFGEPICTYCEFDQFYSYRRDGDTGRFASIIWRE